MLSEKHGIPTASGLHIGNHRMCSGKLQMIAACGRHYMAFENHRMPTVGGHHCDVPDRKHVMVSGKHLMIYEHIRCFQEFKFAYTFNSLNQRFINMWHYLR